GNRVADVQAVAGTRALSGPAQKRGVQNLRPIRLQLGYKRLLGETLGALKGVDGGEIGGLGVAGHVDIGRGVEGDGVADTERGAVFVRPGLVAAEIGRKQEL